MTCVLEGTRPLLLEIQSLVAPSDLAMPRRVGTGVDPKRLAMIVAVLARHAGLPLGGADVFVNVAGGLRIDEPGADLGIALAIASAARGAPVSEGLAAFGEIGLTGRLRPATQASRRLEECRKLGVARVLAPGGTGGCHDCGGLAPPGARGGDRTEGVGCFRGSPESSFGAEPVVNPKRVLRKQRMSRDFRKTLQKCRFCTDFW